MVLFFQKTHLLVLEVAGFVGFFVGKKREIRNKMSSVVFNHNRIYVIVKE